MTVKLIAEDGILKGLVLSLDEGEQWTIGRDPALCQLVIEEASVSRQHALCRKTPEGILLENLSATNPLHVNHQDISTPHLLKQGDTVQIGSIVFRFYEDLEAHVDELPEAAIPDSPKDASAPIPETTGNQSTSSDPSMAPEPSLNPEASHEPSLTSEAPPESSITPETSDPSSEQDVPSTPDHSVGDFDHESSEDTHQTIFEEGGVENSTGDVAPPMLADIDFNLSEGSKWLLKVISGPNNGAEFSLQPGNTYTVGTDPKTCDIVFQDVSVSRQHARLTVSDDEQVQIEDLGSRNGTFLDGTQISTSVSITADAMATLGTTTFVLLNREGERTTMAAPLYPSIAKGEEEKIEEESVGAATTTSEGTSHAATETPPTQQPEPIAAPKRKPINLTALIVSALMAAVLVTVSIAIISLFKTEEIVQPQQDITMQLEAALKPFTPSVRYSFNKSTGNLLLVGHVLTSTDRTQLLYNLQGMPFIKKIDDNVIIDELVWQDINQVISKNPSWRSITIHSPTAGHFVLSGYLKTRKQAEQLSEYLTQNFAYLDLLENRLIVEEDVDTKIDHMLLEEGLSMTTADFADGVVILHGTAQKEQKAQLDAVVEQIKKVPGVRTVKNTIMVLGPSAAVTNLTDKYSVTGSSTGNGKSNVVINGRILFLGDELDGMKITSIEPSVIYLEKDGAKFRIDYKAK